MPNKDDPLELLDLEPAAISAAISNKGKKPVNELDIKKEERLAQKEQRLASGKGQAPPAAPQIPPPAPPVDPGPLLDKIQAYKERFPQLKSRNKITAKSSIEEIEDEIHYLEIQLGSKKDSTLGCQVFVATMAGLETVSSYYNPLGLKLMGLGAVAKDNQAQFQDVVDEIMIKYSMNMYVPPEVRLVLSVGALVVTVHGANSGDARVGATLQRMSAMAKPPQGAEGL